MPPPTQGQGCGPQGMKQQQCLFKTEREGIWSHSLLPGKDAS